MKEKLKIGILLDNNKIPAWSYKMLNKINDDSCNEIVLILKNDVEQEKRQNLFLKILKQRKNILYSIFKKIDNKLHKSNPNAFELKDFGNIEPLRSVDFINITQNDDNEDYIDAKKIVEIKKYDIDVLISMGPSLINKSLIKTTKYGIWTLYFSQNKVSSKYLFGLWEVLENRDETGVELQVFLENRDQPILLDNSFSLTHHTSPNLNRNSYYWKSSSFIPSKIRELYDQGGIDFFNHAQKLNTHPRFYSNTYYKHPTNREMIVLGTKLFLKKILNKSRSLLYTDQWILLYNLNSTKTISTSFFQFKKMLPPRDRFWADPHIIMRNDKYYIFIEELLYSNNKGYIAVIIMDENGEYSKPVKVLEKDYHLSYPYLIEDNGELYMIPETRSNKKIELYKCIDFPLKWELEKTLIDNISAVDATILIKDNIYWLFANVVRNDGASSLDELFLFSSDKLVSDNWIAHPQNPIVSDVKSSRPAGNFFTYNNKLYRPSQNGSKRYGYGMKINEVIEFDKNIYKEKIVDDIYPNWDKKLIATHTINSVDNLTVIDALMKRRKV